MGRRLLDLGRGWLWSLDGDPNETGMLTLGTVFHDRYQVERRIGSGGMGAVYEIIDRPTQRRRALKTMLPDAVADPNLRARFTHEATITAEVDSEHLVEIFDAGIDASTGIPFIVMELLKGEQLGELLERRQRLPPDEVVTLLHQASQALDRTHALNIIHRDLKPENLFITYRDDGSPRLRILDFGIAKLLAQSTRPKTTGILGTPLYMAPEQALGEGTIGPAADLHALGHIAFTLLVGEAFWEAAARNAASPVVLLARVVQGPTETASARASAVGVTLPPRFDGWFARATARSARERFETASELVETLAEALGVPLPREMARTPRMSGTLVEDARPFEVPDPHGSQAGLASDFRPTTSRRTMIPITLALGALAAIALAAVAWIAVPGGARLLSEPSVGAPGENPDMASGVPQVAPISTPHRAPSAVVAIEPAALPPVPAGTTHTSPNARQSRAELPPNPRRAPSHEPPDARRVSDGARPEPSAQSQASDEAEPGRSDPGSTPADPSDVY